MAANPFACEADNIFAAQDECQFVRTYCELDTSTSKYFFEFYYCSVNESVIVFLMLTAVFLPTAFYLLASTAEGYLSPALSKISKKLKISETLAGVTLVAFANGAPDVISSFTAGESEEGIKLVVGSVFGGGLFITTYVLASVVITSNTLLTVNKYSFIRDVGFYLFGIAYLILLGLIGSINLVSTIGFLLIFPVYVTVVYFVERHQDRINQNLEKSLMNNSDSGEGYTVVSVSKAQRRKSQALQDQRNLEMRSHVSKEVKAQILADLSDSVDVPKTPKGEALNVGSLTDLDSGSGKGDVHSPKDELDNAQQRKNLLHKLVHENTNSRCYSCLVYTEKGIRGYKYFLNLLRKLTVPVIKEDGEPNIFAPIYPLTSVWFFMATTGYLFESIDGTWVGFYMLPIQILLSITIWKATGTKAAVIVDAILAIGALIMSIFWIYKIAVLVVGFLQFVGFITELHPTFLGMSLLTWGNSMGELFGSRSLTKMGFGLMALTGCFAAPLFDLLIGFGSSLLRQILHTESYTIAFNIFSFDEAGIEEGNVLLVGTLVVSFTNLLMTFAYVNLNQYQISKKYAVYLMVFYISMIVAATLYSLHLKIYYM